VNRVVVSTRVLVSLCLLDLASPAMCQSFYGP
jgi:hypothetical protein